MASFSDHPLRYELANELHARPFPSVAPPCSAVFLAIKRTDNAVARDRAQDTAHLVQLLDRYGAPHPQPGATHYSGQIGQNTLKWEQHTEFVTYTVFTKRLSARAFDPADFDVFPADWLQDIPGVRVTSALVRVEQETDPAIIRANLADWFVPESLAVSSVLDWSATVAADFRIDPAGHQRFAIFAAPQTGPQRIGRVIQRLCEIETYKSMSMLGFHRARSMTPRMNEMDRDLARLMEQMASPSQKAEATLRDLLPVSAELENIQTRNSFRFGATGAYEAIVSQRIEVLREERFEGRQTFGEFMMRRYDPAMRTVKSTEARLAGMADRAIRAGDLLRTRVDVERSAQNQALLESMDRRADMQLRLQSTVEGLSVVAISYYAVSLAGYLAYPLAGLVGLSKGQMLALITLPVVALVWWLVRRIRARLH